jgi:hypothetical protein
MKLYLIAGKHYAVSGDDLFEKVPEFDPLEALVDNGTMVATAHIVPPLPLRKKPLTKAKKPVRQYVPQKGYKKGTCGKCGQEGHSAWHCPERAAKKHGGSAPKTARTTKVLNRAVVKAKTKYNPDEIVTLARRVANKGMTPQEAADKLGVNVGMWYYLRGRYAKGVQAAKKESAEKVIITPDEIHEQVVELQNMGLTSLRIAQKLKIPLSMVNKYWQREVLAPATEEDILDAEDVEEEEDETI